MKSYRVNINGIDVNASYSEGAVQEIFLPLLRRLTKLCEEKKNRLIVFLAAPPGAGKSTLASFLEKLSRDHKELCNIQAVGMDGFHRRQEYLTSHFTEVDGRMIPMVDIKGAPVTFDLEKLTGAIESISSSSRESTDSVSGQIDILWPSYDRHLHNPVEGTYRITEKIVFIEGNYLLLNEDGWRDLRKYADYCIKITAKEDFLRKRLIDRKIKSGNTEEKARAFVDFSDMANVRICLDNSMEADMVLSLDDVGEYHVESMKRN